MFALKGEIGQFIYAPFILTRYPCHTQAVERASKLVSQASRSRNGEEAICK